MAYVLGAETEDPPTLLLRFLGDASASGDRPTLWVATAEGAQEITIESGAARQFLAALSPAELSPRSPVAGHTVRGTEEIRDRMGYGHRSAVTRAFQELGGPLAEFGLNADHYFKRGRNRWGFQDVRVDIAEVLAAGDDPERLDHVLADWGYDPRELGLAPLNEHLFSHAVRSRLGALLAGADARRTKVSPRGPSTNAGDVHESGQTSEPGGVPSSRLRSWRKAFAAAAVLLAVIVLAVVLLSRSGGSGGPSVTARGGHNETSGGPAHTVKDPANAGGGFGKMLQGGETVSVSCRRPGFKVQDGDTWWYRIASAPWSNRFYATADAFYNNGRRQGTLLHTPKVDRQVRLCSVVKG